MAERSLGRDINLADTVHLEGVEDVGREAAGRLCVLRQRRLRHAIAAIVGHAFILFLSGPDRHLD